MLLNPIVLLLVLQHTTNAQQPPSNENVQLELISWGTPMPQELQVQDPPSKPSFVLLLANDIAWTTSTLEKQSGRFSVRAPRGHGLMAVIQLLNLRESNKPPTPNAGSCRDYIKLSDPTGLLTSTPPICGSLKKENKSFTPPDLIGPRVFHSASGRMEVYYESEPGDPSSTQNNNNNQVVEIVFTGYTDCLVSTFSQQQKCGSKCISHQLTCDEHINCGFQEDFANDEFNCTYPGSKSSTSYSSSSSTSTTQKSTYMIALYSGSFAFVAMVLGVGLYHRHTTYMRIKNIPT